MELQGTFFFCQGTLSAGVTMLDTHCSEVFQRVASLFLRVDWGHGLVFSGAEQVLKWSLFQSSVVM